MPRLFYGVLLALVILVAFGLLLRWTARASRRLSRSGREMRDWNKWT